MVIKQLFKQAIIRPWDLLFREPIVILLSLYLAIVYATLYVSLIILDRADSRCSSALSPLSSSKNEDGLPVSEVLPSWVSWLAS